jgi:hydrogenase nickel incorporation protein HypB
MVRKHPMIFALADVIVINKIDLAEIMEVDTQRIAEDANKVNPHTKICQTDAKHGVGVDDLISQLNIRA